ncbi:peptidase inhibitor 16-like [Strongylocentrotus purpuratus]|uniref:SCP domain-containing protein n=1 Tax=Strongylocentrotus purpuratus TaxID=7668 RepID=A0A7M7NNX9_STRPU|nr:peptidase inhibitor 16-like [Strongylocentrotus purpuratus]
MSSVYLYLHATPHHIIIMICALSLVLVLAVLQGGNGLTDDEKSQIVARHNQYRTNVQPRAANMLALRWNDELANTAQSRANRCEWRVWGKGMSASRGLVDTNLVSFVDWWNIAKRAYNFEDNTCAENCYSYTRMVRATTSLVGCGMTQCEREFAYKVFVCMYGTR